MGWAIVKFTKEDTDEAVPQSWYVKSSEECCWPPNTYKRENIFKLIEHKVIPSSDWNVYAAQILGTYDDFATAQRKAKKAMIMTDLSSNNETFADKGPRSLRKRKRNPKYLSDVSSRDSDSMESSDDNSYPSLRKKVIQSSPVFHEKINYQKSSSIPSTSPFLSEPPPELRCSPLEIPRNKRTELEHVEEDSPMLNGRQNQKSREISNQETRWETPKGKQNTEIREDVIGQDMTNEKRATNRVLIMQNRKNDVPNDQDFKRLVIDELSQLNLKVNSLIDNVASLINTRRLDSTVQLQCFENNVKTMYEKIPIKSEAELTEIEVWLTDENNYRLMISELSRIGGNSVRQSIRKVLYRVITDKVALLYSWDGAKIKHAFKNLRTAKVILDSMKIQYKEATEYEIIDATLDKPANIPVVLAFPSVLYRTRVGGYQAEISLPLGMVVNAIFKNQNWLYVQTPHAEEGYVSYSACLPLGIIPPPEDDQLSPCWEKSTDVFPKPSGNMTDTEKLSCKSECGNEEDTYCSRARYRSAFSTCGEKSVDRLYLRAAAIAKGKGTRHTLLVINEDYKGLGKGAISVTKNEVVFLLSTKIKGWFYVKNKEGHEGFIPSVIAGHGFL